MIEWQGIGQCHGKMKDIKVTNGLNMVHGWQNDGYQKDLFYEDNQDNMCPAGCGMVKRRLNFVSCKVAHPVSA